MMKTPFFEVTRPDRVGSLNSAEWGVSDSAKPMQALPLLFYGCLGALDGTHIKVHVPKEDKPSKNEIETNVLGVCSRDMQFIYVLLGWEGSTTDGRILRTTITRRNDLVVPRGILCILLLLVYINFSIFKMNFQNQDTKGCGKNKRKWKYDEEVKLIEALLDMINLGAYKAETGFKPSYLKYVEKKLQVSLPNSGFKARPHIESRIKTLKKDFHVF
ncbi:hypothetical protein ACS0TY_015263 [Phlomoides rotata]